MISPTPVSLICALLLCLPLAVLYTNTSPASETAIACDVSDCRGSLGPPRKLKLVASPPPPLPKIPVPKDDNSLLRVAARVNSRPLPRTGPRKIAFMFLTTTPLPFAPLWELYFNQTPKSLFNVYVHADPTRDYDPPFSGVFANRTVRSEPSERYSPSLSAAARRLLAHALIDDPSNAMFALLSPSCIPLRSFNFTYETLAKSKLSFIEILENEVGSYDRWAARGPDAMLPEVPLEDFRIGSQFWVLTRKHARLVVGDRKLWPKFNLPCVTLETCYPEENYFPTLLSMRDPRGCVNATLTHVDWAGRYDGHPRMYEASEVDAELLLGIRDCRPRYGDEFDSLSPSSSSSSSSNVSESAAVSPNPVRRRRDPFLFARKFSPESLEPLLSLARGVIFKD